MRVSPQWIQRLKYATICFDEISISKESDIDKLADLVINPERKKEAQIMAFQQIAGPMKFMHFVHVDYLAKAKDIESVSRFEAAGISILSTICDQGTVDNFDLVYPRVSQSV